MLESGLEIGHNYGVAIEGSITSKTEADNHDGTHSVYWKFEPVIVRVVNPKGETIQAKDVRHKSQLLRSALWREWQALGTNEEFDDYYNERMDSFIKDVINGR